VHDRILPIGPGPVDGRWRRSREASARLLAGEHEDLLPVSEEVGSRRRRAVAGLPGVSAARTMRMASSTSMPTLVTPPRTRPPPSAPAPMAFAVAVSLMLGIVAAALPACRAGRLNVADALRRVE
jgi:hypothetical protein